MSDKPMENVPIASMGSIAITFVVLLLSNTCEGRQEISSRIAATDEGDEDRVADAEEGRFPYMCGIRKRGDGTHICGGTLIDKNWMMTAAHCLDPAYPMSAGMSPVLYCNVTERQDRDASKRLTPSRCYLHHKWDAESSTELNDIALCRLDKSADVPIPDLANFGDKFNSSNTFDVLGWGKTGVNEGVADVLQIGSHLAFVSNSDCDNNFSSKIEDSMICAGGTSVDTCKGDSGGPLLIRHDPGNGETLDPKLDLIVGVTAFGIKRCTVEAPGVYTRVSCFRPWIDCIMEGTEQDCSIHEPCEE